MQLVTPRLLLREQTLDDASAAHAYEQLDAVMRYQTSAPRTLDECRAYLARVMADTAATPRRLYDFAVTLRSDPTGVMIGRAGVSLQDDDAHNAAIWYVLHPGHQGHGYATEAMRELVRFAFADLRIHRLWADIDPRNAPSELLVQRLAFRREAHHLQNVLVKGEWCDTVIYAQLRSEWLLEQEPGTPVSHG